MTYLEILAREYWISSRRILGRDPLPRLATAFTFVRACAMAGKPEPIRTRAERLLEKMPQLRPLN